MAMATRCVWPRECDRVSAARRVWLGACGPGEGAVRVTAQPAPGFAAAGPRIGAAGPAGTKATGRAGAGPHGLAAAAQAMAVRGGRTAQFIALAAMPTAIISGQKA